MRDTTFIAINEKSSMIINGPPPPRFFEFITHKDALLYADHLPHPTPLPNHSILHNIYLFLGSGLVIELDIKLNEY